MSIGRHGTLADHSLRQDCKIHGKSVAGISKECAALMRWLKAVAARIVADETVAVDLPDDLGAPSADIIYQETLRTLADQQSDIQTLDAKASFFLTSATILVGTSGFPGTSTLFVERRDLLTVVLVIYFFLLICVVQAYRLRGLSPAGLRASELPWPTVRSEGCVSNTRIPVSLSLGDRSLEDEPHGVFGLHAHRDEDAL